MAAFNITLTGGAPWGFSMAGGIDFNQPLNVSKVTSGGKAAMKGMRPGLVILQVNGQDVSNLRHMDATQYVKACSRSGQLSLMLDPSPIRHGEDLNAILGDISTVPDMYRETSPIRTQQSYQRPTSASAPTSNQLFNTLPEPAAPAPQRVAPPPQAPQQSLSPQPPVQHFSPTPVQYSPSPVQSFSPAPAAFSPAPAASPAMQQQQHQQQTFSPPPPPMKQTPSPQPSQPADFIEHRPIDHNESKRRIFDDSAQSGGQWRPDAYQSTQQSPSFIKAVKPPSSNGSGPNLAEPIKLDINPELKNMINSDNSTPVYQPSATKPVSAPVKTFEPSKPTPPAPMKTHDLANPEKSGVLRLPTVNFKQMQQQQPKPTDAKSNALGNLSSFMNKKSGGGVTKGTLGKPEFLTALVDRICPMGEPCVLEVRLAGSPPLTVQWYHNNQPMRESIERDIRLLQKGNVYTLVHGELNRSLLGRYSCQATNNKGTSTSSCVITEGGYDDIDYPTATYQHGPPPPSNPAYKSTVQSQQQGLPSQTKVVTKKPLNQLVTSGNAGLYSSNAIEEGLHSALGIQPEQEQPSQDTSAVMAAIDGRGEERKTTSRTLARLAQQLDEDL